MKTMNKTIDILLVAYNQEKYIRQALDGIFIQRLENDIKMRIIVADDASRDNTLAIIKRRAPESPFPMVFLPEESNMGISKNYKRSFASTEAECVVILEGDDYWLRGLVPGVYEERNNHRFVERSMGFLRIPFHSTT